MNGYSSKTIWHIKAGVGEKDGMGTGNFPYVMARKMRFGEM